MSATNAPAQTHFDLDALEFSVVRTMLLERLVSPLGRTAVEALVPMADAEAAVARLRLVERLASRQRAGQSLPLSGAVEVRSWLVPFTRGEHSLQAKELADLKRSVRAAERCRRWFLAGTEELTGFARGVPDLNDLVGELEEAIDDRGEVLSSASRKLTEVRKEIETARIAVDHAVASVLHASDLRRYLQSPEPSWRNGRPVLAVKQEYRGRVPGVLHDRSGSGATLFIEPNRVVEAANKLSDAQAAEHREINVVLANLSRGLKKLSDEVQQSIEFLALSDLVQAKARLCVDDGFVVPKVTQSGVLRLVDARHPLLLRQAKAVDIVPLDLGLGDPGRVLVVTGPNTGGKTVVLKTTGLLCLMALSGVPIPAGEGSQVPWLSAVQADIGDEQGISQNLSTFSSHVQRLESCLAHAGKQALVLLDELGAGTDPEEGAALGYAILERLLHRGAFAIVSTHLGRLKDFAYQQDGAENGSMAFDGKSLAPLYRLDIGIPGQSHALDIATRVGMPKDVVKRARELLGERDTQLTDVIQKVQDARRSAEADRRRTQQISLDVEHKQQELVTRRAEADKKEGWLQEESDAVLEDVLRDAQKELLAGLKPLLSAPGQHGERARQLDKTVQKLLAARPVHRRRMRFCHSLKKGDAVFVPRFSRVCRVHKVDKIKEIISIDYGNVKMELPFEDVSWLQPVE